MGWRTSAEYAEQCEMFLLDGLCRAPSPVLLVVDEVETAAQVARALYEGSAGWDERPARAAGLLQLDLARIAGDMAGDFTKLLAELASSDHWIYLPDIDSLVESPSGRRFLDGLMNAVASGELAAVIASTTPERLSKVQAEALRLMGFASSVSRADGLTCTRSTVVDSRDSADEGWVVVVRYELTESIREDATDIPTDGRLQLVESIHMVGRRGEPPLGVMLSLTPDAFTVSQENAAFASAVVAAKRLVGRELGAEEQITPARGIFYG